MSRLVLTLTLAFSALAMLAAPSASALDLDSLMAVSSQVSVRALAVSEPPPPPPPPPITDGRVIIAPTGAAPGEQFGNSVASAGDVNGDGYPDLIVGSWTSDLTTGDAGAAFVYFGGPSADAVPDLVLRGQSFDDNFGTSVASAGDMNGDGYDDVIVGAWRATSTTRTGRAYVFFGGPTPNADADLVLAGEAPDDHFGVSVAGGGDLNGDGFADVVIGASGYGFGRGRAYVYFGGTVPNTTVDLRVSGESVGDGFGFAVACGDWDGDGHMDFLVGSPQANGMGKGYLYRGGPSLDATADRIFSGEALGDNFGTSVASAGDVDGDGYGDLLVGGAEHAQVFLGSPAGIATTATLTLAGSTTNGQTGAGNPVQGPADVNGDGRPDLYVGGNLYLSSPAGLAAEAAFANHFGTQLGSFAGDENGDGFGDFASFHVYPGTPAGIDTSSLLFDQAGEIMLGTAGDVDGDGFSDTIASLSSIENMTDRQRVYFGAPGSCGATGCRPHEGIPIPGHDFMGGNLTAFLGGVGDVNGDGLDDLVASTPDTGKGYFYGSVAGSINNEAFAFPTWSFPTGFGTSFAALFGSVRPLQ